MEITITNLMDAFKALEDIPDEDVAARDTRRRLREGRSFDIRSPQEMEEAGEYIKPVKKEVKLEVIDPDADSVQHLKDNEEYIGQMILQCAVCKSKIFLDADKLQVSEDDEDIFNKDLECPHCHKEGRGFTLLGQVGKVTEEEKEEPAVDNDSLTAQEDEVKFDKEEPEEEEAEEPKIEAEEEPKDDTSDEVEVNFGEEEPAQEPAEDETPEEAPAEEATSADDEEIKPIEEEEPKEDEENESLEEDVEVPTLKVSELFNRFVEPDNIKVITIWDVNEDGEKKIYEGTYEDMPDSFNGSEVSSFDVDGGKLVINTDITADAIEGNTVGDLLSWFGDEFDADLMIEDPEQGELANGAKGSLLSVYGELPVIFLNAPERLNIYCGEVPVADALKSDVEEEFDMAEDEDRLVEEVLRGCGYKVNRANIESTPEYWIAESIRQREDLKVIYENYVMQCSEDVQRAFKDITGYQDRLDEAMLDEKDAASTPVDMDQAIEKAKDLLAKSDAYAVIYGYQKNGKFFGFKDPIICRDDSTYKDKIEIINLRYRPTGSISTLFHRAIEESVDVDSRKALVKLIDECRNNKQPYSIKSRGNGKYTLLRESPAPLAVVDEPAIDGEVVNQTPSTEVNYGSDVMDPRDRELVDKLIRIARDTADAISTTYHVYADPRAILADMVQDLQLVSGQLKPEDIADTPMNSLTKQMYQAYNGFYDAMDEMVSFISGRPIRTSQAQKLGQAIESLDSDMFTREAIEMRIRSPQFLMAMRQGAVPGIDYSGRRPRDTALIGNYREAFDVRAFREFINEQLDDANDETFVFDYDDVDVDEGMITVTGKVIDEDHNEEKVQFNIKPALNEAEGDESYVVTNNLTEEKMIFNPKKINEDFITTMATWHDYQRALKELGIDIKDAKEHEEEIVNKVQEYVEEKGGSSDLIGEFVRGFIQNGFEVPEDIKEE